MERDLQIDLEGMREVIRRLRAWVPVWEETFRRAQRTGIALVRMVRAIPGRRFEEETERPKGHLSQASAQVRILADTLEQALLHLEAAFLQAAKMVERTEESIGKGTPPTTALSASFEEAYAFVRRWEGGYVHDPDDPGGATNMGITQSTYDAWRQEKGLPPQDVRALTPEEAQAIYLEKYWASSGAATIPSPALAMIHFDTAVNMGPGRAGEFLKRVQEEGRSSPRELAEAYLDLRLNRYLEIAHRFPSQRKFLGGWLNRLRDLAEAATGDPEFAASFERKVEQALEARAAEDPAYATILERFRRKWRR
ncbi:MAG: hypothetical protein J7452_02260 [Thermoflexus sp.]|jgi:hypothetical protein|nr:hypothetical protein [Thermoflexus sp.]